LSTEQEQKEKEEVQLLLKQKEKRRKTLKNPNQFLPAKELSSKHQTQHLKEQIAKTKFQMTIIASCFCLFLFIGLLIAFPTQPIESGYASQLAGGFPSNFGIVVGGLCGCLMLCVLLLDRINPNIAKKMQAEFRTEHPEWFKD
jgi:hypothetical protein